MLFNEQEIVISLFKKDINQPYFNICLYKLLQIDTLKNTVINNAFKCNIMLSPTNVTLYHTRCIEFKND